MASLAWVNKYLAGIMARHREIAELDERDVDKEIEAAASLGGPGRFAECIREDSGLSVIAEIKKRSPSVGDLDLGIDPKELATIYESAGAACISVLTDEEFFGGSLQDLCDVSGTVSVPILRKDFTVSELDLCDAKKAGADCALLIVAALTDDELDRLSRAAATLGLDVITEVHDASELKRAVDTGSTMVGINQRNLKTFEIDRNRAMELVQSVPPQCLKIAESGIGDPSDVDVLVDVGFDAVLIGEAIIRSSDRAQAVRAFVSAGQRGHAVA